MGTHQDAFSLEKCSISAADRESRDMEGVAQGEAQKFTTATMLDGLFGFVRTLIEYYLM